MAMMPGCPVQPVIYPTQCCYRDCYHPQLVPHIHPIEMITRHHTVMIPQHVYTYSARDETGGCHHQMPGSPNF